MTQPSLVFSAAILAVSFTPLAGAEVDAVGSSYYRETVYPVLKENCFKCHGPDPKTREGDFAFHEKEMAFKALGENKDHYAIIPGDPENSTLIQRLFSTDENEMMPPPESNLTISDYEKEILKKWIAQGAQ